MRREDIHLGEKRLRSAIQSIGCFVCEGMFLLRNAFQTSESHGMFEVAVYFNDSFPSHQNSWDPSMMGFDR